jgi:hypothetical protein
MDSTIVLTLVALVLALAGLGWTAWTWWRLRALGLGLGLGAGPLPERLEAVSRRLAALEAGHTGLAQSLARAGLHATAVHYAPLGLGGATNCFALALLNGQGDGVVLNYLAGTGVRADLKELRGWQSQGLALTDEESQAVSANRTWWDSVTT